MTRMIWYGVVNLALVFLDSSSLLADGSSDLEIEKRMWVIAEDLDCPVCEGQSVRESTAALAVQMRNTIVAKLKAGHSKDQIMQFFADRYGPGVLRNPPREGLALAVWIGPLIAIGCGVVLLLGVFARSKQAVQAQNDADLSSYEEVVKDIHKPPRRSDESS